MPIPFLKDSLGYFFTTGPLQLRYARLDGSLLGVEDEEKIRKHGVAFARFRRRYFDTSEDADKAQTGVDYAPSRGSLRELATI